MADVRILALVFAAIVVLGLIGYTLFGNFLQSPQEWCGAQGKVYNSNTGTCIPTVGMAGGTGQSCAPLVSNGLCQYGLQCNFEAIGVLNAFFTCQGVPTYQVQGQTKGAK